MFDPVFTNQLKESFGLLADALREPDKTCFLLKRGEHSGKLKIVRRLTAAFAVS